MESGFLATLGPGMTADSSMTEESQGGRIFFSSAGRSLANPRLVPTSFPASSKREWLTPNTRLFVRASTETVIAFQLSIEWSQIVSVAAVLLTLVLRPAGLLGKRPAF